MHILQAVNILVNYIVTEEFRMPSPSDTHYNQYFNTRALSSLLTESLTVPEAVWQRGLKAKQNTILPSSFSDPNEGT